MRRIWRSGVPQFLSHQSLIFNQDWVTSMNGPHQIRLWNGWLLAGYQIGYCVLPLLHLPWIRKIICDICRPWLQMIPSYLIISDTWWCTWIFHGCFHYTAPRQLGNISSEIYVFKTLTLEIPSSLDQREHPREGSFSSEIYLVSDNNFLI